MNRETIVDTLDFVNEVRNMLRLDELPALIPGVRGDCDECPITNSIIDGLSLEWSVETSLQLDNPYVAIRFDEDFVEGWTKAQRNKAWKDLVGHGSGSDYLSTDEDGLNRELRVPMPEAAVQFVTKFDALGDVYAPELVSA